MNSRKITIVVLVVIVSIGLIINTHINLEGTKVEEIEEKTNNNTFAIYWDENGTGTYTEYTKATWPNGYSLDLDKTVCVSENGSKMNSSVLSYDASNNSIALSTAETVYCTIYFSKCNGAVGTILEGKPGVSSCQFGGMYRYQGTDDVNNYICFGTVDQTACKNNVDKYMYRIIGVTPDGELKLIKETILKEDNIVNFQVNSRTTKNECGSDGSKCVWPLTILFKRLNGLGNKSTSKTTGPTGDSNIFIGNTYYDYLSVENWADKIAYHNWQYGISNGTILSSGHNAYQIESNFKNSVVAKIGLQYIHDYYYAYPGGKPENNNEAAKSWIFFKKNNSNTDKFELALTIDGMVYDTWYWYIIIDDGTTGSIALTTQKDVTIRPVFYLTPDVTFMDGTTGEKTNPYILDGIYTANFYFGSAKNSTIPYSSSGAGWRATWTLPNATEYCVTRQSVDKCTWKSLPPQTNAYNYGEYFPSTGTIRYYFYVRNALGQMASDSDTVIVT